MTTFEELKERICKELDEVAIVELLDLRCMDLLNAFEDKLESLLEAHKLDDWLDDSENGESE